MASSSAYSNLFQKPPMSAATCVKATRSKSNFSFRLYTLWMFPRHAKVKHNHILTTEYLVYDFLKIEARLPMETSYKKIRGSST